MEMMCSVAAAIPSEALRSTPSSLAEVAVEQIDAAAVFTGAGGECGSVMLCRIQEDHYVGGKKDLRVFFIK
jgi:hypothetical protein